MKSLTLTKRLHTMTEADTQGIDQAHTMLRNAQRNQGHETPGPRTLDDMTEHTRSKTNRLVRSHPITWIYIGMHCLSLTVLLCLIDWYDLRFHATRIPVTTHHPQTSDRHGAWAHGRRVVGTVGVPP